MNKKKILNCIVPLLSGIVFAVYSYLKLSDASDMLYAAQEHSLWQSGSLFFNEMLQSSGGIFSWAGCYLTQYFYYPTLGISILISLWILIYGLLVWGGKMQWWLSPFAILLLLPFLNAILHTGYFIYHLKLPNWWFTPTLFFLAFALLFAAFRAVRFKIRIAIQIAILLVGICDIDHWGRSAEIPEELCETLLPDTPDSNYLTELRMERAAIEGDWDNILKEAKHAKQLPTRLMLLYQNMALFNTDRLSSDWLNYQPLSVLPQFPDSLKWEFIKGKQKEKIIKKQGKPMSEISAARIYLQHGLPQFAHRWAMEDMVEFAPSVRNIRLMAECALLSDQYDAVRKYTYILKNTTFHREEAEALEQLAAHPKQIASDPRYKKALILAKSQTDMLDSDNSLCEQYLWNHFSTLVNGDVPELNQLCLHYALLTQDIERFWNQFFAYAHLHRGEEMPRIYQEAAYLYGTLEPHRVDIRQLPFDKAVIESYNSFMQASQTQIKLKVKEDKMGAALRSQFGHTFFWFYYFVRNQDSY